MYIPMPDKESVYYDLIPLKTQSNYLHRLSSLLTQNGVDNINTLEIYNNYRKSSDIYLYHIDDTHWNEIGVEIISDIVSNKIKIIFSLIDDK